MKRNVLIFLTTGLLTFGVIKVALRTPDALHVAAVQSEWGDAPTLYYSPTPIFSQPCDNGWYRLSTRAFTVCPPDPACADRATCIGVLCAPWTLSAFFKGSTQKASQWLMELTEQERMQQSRDFCSGGKWATFGRAVML